MFASTNHNRPPGSFSAQLHLRRDKRKVRDAVKWSRPGLQLTLIICRTRKSRAAGVWNLQERANITRRYKEQISTYQHTQTTRGRKLMMGVCNVQQTAADRVDSCLQDDSYFGTRTANLCRALRCLGLDGCIDSGQSLCLQACDTEITWSVSTYCHSAG